METQPQICCCDRIPHQRPYLEPVQKMTAVEETDEHAIEVFSRGQTICVVINSGRYQIIVEID